MDSRRLICCLPISTHGIVPTRNCVWKESVNIRFGSLADIKATQRHVFEELTHLLREQRQSPALAGSSEPGVRLLTRLDISELSMDQEIAGVQVCTSDVFQ